MTTTVVAVKKNDALIPAGAAKTFGELIQKSDLMQRCAEALPKFCTPERWWRAVLTAINKTPKLKDCTPESVMGCFLEVAQTGLQIGGALGEAYLIPFADRRNNRTLCTVVYGWKGLIKLCYNGGSLKSITCDVVHERDVFEHERGTSPRLRHVPCPDDDPGPIIASYAVAHLAEGGVDFEILWPRDIKKIRAVSRSTSGPWFDWEEQMWKKSALRRLQNRLPKSSDALVAISNEDERMQSAGVYRATVQSIGAARQIEGDVIDVEPEVSPQFDEKAEKVLALFESNELNGATRVTFVAKIAKAKSIPLQLVDGKLPYPTQMPEPLLEALIEELTKSK